jgi:HK97 family phage prohead protease
MERTMLALDLAEVKFDAAGAGTFEGYASVFGGVDSHGDTIHPGAYTKAVGDGLEVKMYFNHGWKKHELPIGKMLVRQNDRGLRVERGEFTRGLRAAEEVKLAMEHGTVSGLSIAYRVTEAGVKSKGMGLGRNIYEIDWLKEVSVVDWPSDEAAQIDMKAAVEEAATIREIEVLLRDAAGLSRADACALVSRIKSLAQGELAAEQKRLAELARTFQQFTVG